MIKNIFLDLINKLVQIQRKYDYIIYPMIIFIIYICLYYKLDILLLDNDFLSNLISIASALIGFLIAAHSILIAMPSDKEFIKLLKEYGYFKKMFIHILFAEIFFVLCLIFSLFQINIFISSIFFIIGLTYTILLSVILFKISFYIMI